MVYPNNSLLFTSTNICQDAQVWILPSLISTPCSCQVLLLIVLPPWTTAKFFPVFHSRLCQLPKPWSHQRSPLLKLPTLCFTPSSFPAPAGSNVSSTSDYRILPQTNLFVLKETALYLHILSFFYNSHAAKDFSINSERQLRFFLRSLSLKLSFTVMFTKKVSLV